MKNVPDFLDDEFFEDQYISVLHRLGRIYVHQPTPELFAVMRTLAATVMREYGEEHTQDVKEILTVASAIGTGGKTQK